MTPQLNIKLQILRGLLCCAGIAIGGSTIPAAAQTTRPDSASAQTESTEAKRTLPTPAEVTAAAADEKKEEVVKLSPFTVYGEAEVGYQAKTTTAATRLRTNVDDVGSALQIVTSQFLQNTGATNNQSLLTYTAGTEVYGTYGNFEGNGNGQTVYEMWGSLQRPDLNTRIRGLSVADNARDFELSDIQWDAYNIDTVEVQRGANAILFGLGSPGGLVNASLKQAAYKDSGEIVGRYGSYKSFRASLDVNHVLLPNELALRVDLLKERQNFERLVTPNAASWLSVTIRQFSTRGLPTPRCGSTTRRVIFPQRTRVPCPRWTPSLLGSRREPQPLARRLTTIQIKGHGTTGIRVSISRTLPIPASSRPGTPITSPGSTLIIRAVTPISPARVRRTRGLRAAPCGAPWRCRKGYART